MTCKVCYTLVDMVIITNEMANFSNNMSHNHDMTCNLCYSLCYTLVDMVIITNGMANGDNYKRNGKYFKQ